MLPSHTHTLLKAAKHKKNISKFSLHKKQQRFLLSLHCLASTPEWLRKINVSLIEQRSSKNDSGIVNETFVPPSQVRPKQEKQEQETW